MFLNPTFKKTYLALTGASHSHVRARAGKTWVREEEEEVEERKKEKGKGCTVSRISMNFLHANATHIHALHGQMHEKIKNATYVMIKQKQTKKEKRKNKTMKYIFGGGGN